MLSQGGERLDLTPGHVYTKSLAYNLHIIYMEKPSDNRLFWTVVVIGFFLLWLMVGSTKGTDTGPDTNGVSHCCQQ